MVTDLVSVFERINNCGSTSTEFVDSRGDFFEVPQYCNNRGCSNEGCQKHRGYLHVKNHGSQISTIEKQITSPKGFVFTGWKLKIDSQLKEFSRSKLIELYQLLNRYSKTQFVIYMEFKLKDESTVYLHFHVVTGSVGDIHQVQALWRRKVSYQYPIVSDEALLQYIRKYASKSPAYQSKIQKENYVALTYKLQMCRYSIRKDPDYIRVKSDCLPVAVLVSESKYAIEGKYSEQEMAMIVKHNKAWRERDNAFYDRLRRAIDETNKRYQ